MSLCPGRTVRAVSESGAPRKTAGMASKNVWEMLAERMMEDISNGVRPQARSCGERAKSMAAKLFRCRPGVRPLMIPRKKPRAMQAKRVRSGILTS
jgi:L-serine deaminase